MKQYKAEIGKIYELNYRDGRIIVLCTNNVIGNLNVIWDGWFEAKFIMGTGAYTNGMGFTNRMAEVFIVREIL